MIDYVLFRLKYRQGNYPPEQTVVEILDRGNQRENRDAAEELGKAWLLTQRSTHAQGHRYISVEPFVATTERPVTTEPEPEKVSSIYEATAKKQAEAKQIQPLRV